MTDKKTPIDWAGIEADYCRSTQSIREIARWYQISDAAIRKKAKLAGWVRPEAEAPAAKKEAPRDPDIMAGVDATKPENIVNRGQNLILRLLGELDAVTTYGADLADMIEAHEEDPRRKAAMLKAIELPSRANVIKALATAFKTWSETQAMAPDGKKAQRKADAEAHAAAGNKFSPPAAPKLIVSNR